MFGFKDRYEYYRASTIAGKIGGISVPTFSLTALDD
jgi:predicted alpha/beta-fold hydrolase